MILINKQSNPQSLSIYKNTEGATYDACPTEIKDDIRKKLLREQGYVCAYCMAAIDIGKMKIEHYECRSVELSKQLDYENLLAVCMGGANVKGREKTCDTKKGDIKLHQVNPLDINTINVIKYKSDGIIYSNNHLLDQELNHVLNLNSEESYFLKNRLDTKLEIIKTMKKDGEWSKLRVKKYLDFLKGIGNEKVVQFSGMAIYYLEKKL